MLLNASNELSYYRVGFMLKEFVTIALTIIPIVIIIKCMIDLFKVVTNPEEAKNTPKTIARRLISGLIVFLLPILINYTFHELTEYKDDLIVKYYEGSSREKIKEYEQLAEKERQEALNKKIAEAKETAKKQEEERRKRNEEMEEQRKENDQRKNNNNDGNNNNNDNNNQPPVEGTTGGDGSYGALTVKNGVFYIPNRRATSDADTPKQSGNYGLNPIFWSRLEKLINDAKAQGYNIGISSAWRPYSKQKQLWDSSSRPCSERSKWVACPGGSRHGFGIAADLKFNGSSCSQGNWDCNAAARWVHNNASRYGLKFRMSWEPWHIEPDQVQGGSFGSCQASCR